MSVSWKSSPLVMASTSSMAELFEDSSRLARSASLRNFCRARASLEMSMCRSFVICFTKWAMICWSKSSPPRFVSPDVASTSKTPWSMVRRVTSKVPPPRSKTRMFRCLLPMSMMAVSWAVIRGPAAAGRAGGALGGSRAGRSQESHPPLTTADHSACKVLPGSGASHDSSANELAVSRAEEQGRPKHPGAEHGPCNRFTQTGLIQTWPMQPLHTDTAHIADGPAHFADNPTSPAAEPTAQPTAVLTDMPTATPAASRPPPRVPFRPAPCSQPPAFQFGASQRASRRGGVLRGATRGTPI